MSYAEIIASDRRYTILCDILSGIDFYIHMKTFKSEISQIKKVVYTYYGFLSTYFIYCFKGSLVGVMVFGVKYVEGGIYENKYM